MSNRQFVACKFSSEDSRSYTYHNDGEPLVVGDIAKVADARSDGWKRVEVVSISDDEPPFPTKAILGKVEPEPAEGLAEAGEQWSRDIDPEELF